ncbi:hypothetical protein [uncultured Paracoccus sp.]|uniref:hypothetical protein n=1 Tax=uncultured Paracoccus sp. TaxID=189685 RepID=UPI00261DD05D|nr:hypothetical protein [uncultured Paracoccus sp.]
MTEKSARTQRRELRKRIAAEGAPAAFEAALAICKDPKAPAPARATCAVAMFRAAGMFDKTDDPLDDKQLEEMTPQERNERMAELEDRLRQLDREAELIGLKYSEGADAESADLNDSLFD